MISGEDEARLTLLGVTEGLPDLRGDFLLFDIGGGSTEFVLSRAGRASQAVSVKLGVVELAERFMDQGPADPARYDAMAAASRSSALSMAPGQRRIRIDDGHTGQDLRHRHQMRC